MKTITKRLTLNLGKLAEKQLLEIMKMTGDNYTQAITRIIDA